MRHQIRILLLITLAKLLTFESYSQSSPLTKGDLKKIFKESAQSDKRGIQTGKYWRTCNADSTNDTITMNVNGYPENCCEYLMWSFNTKNSFWRIVRTCGASSRVTSDPFKVKIKEDNSKLYLKVFHRGKLTEVLNVAGFYTQENNVDNKSVTILTLVKEHN